MCCLFGILDYGNTLSVRTRTRVLTILARACEVRGTDATGIAYNTGGHLTIYKRPYPAHRMRFHLPADASVIMGHTRMTTQGNEKFNFNNHPFSGKIGTTSFALAHNGIITNDDILRKGFSLPETNIETDSYVAVQLMEQHRELNFDTIAKTAELLEGSFTLSLLDYENNVYFVKGNNPLCIYHWESRNLYIYASTEEILKTALSKMHCNLGKGESVKISEGDILKISNNGSVSQSQFSLYNLYSSYRVHYPYYSYFHDDWEIDKPAPTYREILHSVARSFGYSNDDVDNLLKDGFSPEEIEEMFYESEVYF